MSVAVSLNPRLKHRAHQQPHQRLISVRELFEIRDQRQLCAVVRLRGNARNMRCLRALRHVAVTQPIARHTDHQCQHHQLLLRWYRLADQPFAARMHTHAGSAESRIKFSRHACWVRFDVVLHQALAQPIREATALAVFGDGVSDLFWRATGSHGINLCLIVGQYSRLTTYLRCV